MPRGKKPGSLRRISQEIINEISSHISQPANKGKTRETLAEEIFERLESLGIKSPTIETIVRKISELKQSQGYVDTHPWSISTLAQYPLPPDALETLLQFKERGWTPTIRESQWVARFFKLPMSGYQIKYFAQAYAFHEMISQTFEDDSGESEDKIEPILLWVLADEGRRNKIAPISIKEEIEYMNKHKDEWAEEFRRTLLGTEGNNK